MMNEINDNYQRLYSTNGFRRTFSSKSYNVEVWRDWDGNRLVKTVDGKVVAEMAIPRNWTDKGRGDGRKWRVGAVMPCGGFHLKPMVRVVFEDWNGGRLTGRSVAKEF